MVSDKEKFTLLIEEIIYTEMSVDQQTEYELDDGELINSVFGESDQSEGISCEEQKFAIGISQDALDIVGITTSFSSLIISCINLYLDLKKNKDQRLNQEIEKMEAIKKLKKYMEEQQMPAELIDKINDRYALQIIETMDSLS